MLKRFGLASLLLIAVGATQASAAVITQWNFNSTTPDADTATGVTTPSTGTGAASLVGGLGAVFASGDASGGSSDPTTGTPTDDSGWNLSTGWNPANGTSQSQGAQFAVSTVGMENITVNFDLRQSNSSSRFSAFQYSIDGTSFTTLTNDSLITMGSDPNATPTVGSVSNGIMSRSTGDRWLNNNSINLSSIAGVSNNANFAFRIVAAHDPLTSVFVGTNGGATPVAYTGGTYRFDMVTVNGVTAVPEPASMAMLTLAGASAIGYRLRRRKLQSA
jgi:hypothetical protein